MKQVDNFKIEEIGQIKNSGLIEKFLKVSLISDVKTTVDSIRDSMYNLFHETSFSDFRSVEKILVVKQENSDKFIVTVVLNECSSFSY